MQKYSWKQKRNNKKQKTSWMDNYTTDLCQTTQESKIQQKLAFILEQLDINPFFQLAFKEKSLMPLTVAQKVE